MAAPRAISLKVLTFAHCIGRARWLFFLPCFVSFKYLSAISRSKLENLRLVFLKIRYHWIPCKDSDESYDVLKRFKHSFPWHDLVQTLHRWCLQSLSLIKAKLGAVHSLECRFGWWIWLRKWRMLHAVKHILFYHLHQDYKRYKSQGVDFAQWMSRWPHAIWPVQQSKFVQSMALSWVSSASFSPHFHCSTM